MVVVFRNKTLDFLRLIAAFFVVCIHTRTIDHFKPGSLSFIIDNIARFAVPFFFIAGGYLINFEHRSRLWRKLLSIILLYVLWSAIFIGIRHLYGLGYPEFHFSGNTSWNKYCNVLYKLLIFGYERHLWFFPAYVAAAVLVYFLRHSIKLLLVLAILCYLTGLAGQQYRFLLISEQDISSVRLADWLAQTHFTRNGLFFAFPCMAAGFVTRKWQQYIPYLGLKKVMAGIIMLFIAQYAECFVGAKYLGVQQVDFYFFTLPLSTLLLLLAIQHNRSGIASNMGKWSSGIYILHPLLIYGLLIYCKEAFQWMYWPYVYTPLLFISSLLLTIFLSHIPVVRRLIIV